MSHKIPVKSVVNPPHLVALSTFFRDKSASDISLESLPNTLDCDETEGTEDNSPKDNSGMFTSAQSAMKFILAGKATLTLVSKKTQNRFTYRVTAKDTENGGKIYFVALLNGPDNETSYQYFGYIKQQYAGLVYYHGRAKAKVSQDAPSAKAFDWTFKRLSAGTIPEGLEVWHSSHCGRCNRRLTVPSSISQGFGPECVKLM